jgi:lipid-A-disaccharide synthase
MDKLVVTELIQDDLNEQLLKTELEKLLNNKQHRQQVIDDYEQLWHLLGDKPASTTAAKEIVALSSQ